MNLTQPFREGVERVSTAVSDTLDFCFAKINALWNIEHDAEGHHTAITADSIADGGQLSVGDAATFTGQVTIEATNLAEGITAVLDRPSLTVRAPTQAGSPANPLVQAFEGPSNAIFGGRITFGKKGTSTLAGTQYWGDTTSVGLSWKLGGSTGEYTFFNSAGTELVRLTTAGMYERARTVRLGEWTAVSFTAGDYTASAGTWTLTAPDMVLFKYMLVGTTMWIRFAFATTSVSAAPGFLKFKIPGGFTAKDAETDCTLTYNDNGAGFVTAGNVLTIAGDTNIWLQPAALGVGAWTASANLTEVRGHIVFEVQ